jgi:hypothetical protein
VSGEREAVAAAAHRGFHEAWTIGEPLDLYHDSPVWLAIADTILTALAATAPAHDEAAAALERVRALADTWQRELDTRAIRDEIARYCWTTAAREVRATLAPTAAEQVHAARAVADRDAARIAGQVRASGEGREG